MLQPNYFKLKPQVHPDSAPASASEPEDVCRVHASTSESVGVAAAACKPDSDSGPITGVSPPSPDHNQAGIAAQLAPVPGPLSQAVGSSPGREGALAGSASTGYAAVQSATVPTTVTPICPTTSTTPQQPLAPSHSGITTVPSAPAPLALKLPANGSDGPGDRRVPLETAVVHLGLYALKAQVADASRPRNIFSEVRLLESGILG